MIIKSALTRAFQKYNHWITVYPITTQAWTSGILALFGDIFTQKLEDSIRARKAREAKEQQEKNQVSHNGHPVPLATLSPSDHDSDAALDIRRNCSIAVFGLWYGWWGHYWYKFLDRFAHKMAKPGSFKFVMTKVGSEQVFWNPATLIAYFASVSIMEGKPNSYITQKLTEDFAPTLAIELLTWPALTGIIFKYSPVRYQLVWINIMELFYDAFLSWIQHNGYHMPGMKQH